MNDDGPPAGATSTSLAAVGAPAQRARAAAGIPAPSRPPTVTTTMFAPRGFTLAGVEEVPTTPSRCHRSSRPSSS
ncbi:hypothetical protein ACWGLP_00340 [Streptomyces lydicus]